MTLFYITKDKCPARLMRAEDRRYGKWTELHHQAQLYKHRSRAERVAKQYPGAVVRKVAKCKFSDLFFYGKRGR